MANQRYNQSRGAEKEGMIQMRLTSKDSTGTLRERRWANHKHEWFAGAVETRRQQEYDTGKEKTRKNMRQTERKSFEQFSKTRITSSH